MCEILGTTVKDVLMQTDKFSADGAPRSRTGGAFKVLFKNFTEGAHCALIFRRLQTTITLTLIF